MKIAAVWFWLSSKRQFRKRSFLFLFFLLPILSFFMSSHSGTGNNNLKIGLYAEELGIAEEITDRLLQKKSLVLFYRVESEEQLYKDVEIGEAECGYIFYEGFAKNLEENNLNKQIGLITSPSTIIDKLSTEIVFSSLIDVYGSRILETYVENDNLFPSTIKTNAKDEILNAYEKYKSDGSTFRFEYETIASAPIDFTKSGTMVFPIKGIVSVYIFIIGMFSVVLYYRDEKRGVYLPVPYELKSWCCLITIGTPVFWASVSGMISIFISGTNTDIVREVIAILLYIVGIVLFCYCLSIIFKNENKLTAIIPMITIGCLVFCPVFVNIKDFVPVLGVLEKLFLPYYYLSVFQQGTYLYLIGFILCFVIIDLMLRKGR